MTTLFGDRHIQLLAAHGIPECHERLVSAARRDTIVGLADGEPIRLFVLPAGLRAGRRLFLEGTCTFLDRATATQVDLHVGLTMSHRITWSLVLPFFALMQVLFAWVLASRSYETPMELLVVALFAAYIAGLVFVIGGQVGEWRDQIDKDAELFARFVSRALDGAQLEEKA